VRKSKIVKKPKWQCVHLTVYEVEGLKAIHKQFHDWAYAKTNFPKDLKESPEDLLERLEELIEYHEEDDQILACRGINIFKQYKDAIKYDKTKQQEKSDEKGFNDQTALTPPTIKKEPSDDNDVSSKKVTPKKKTTPTKKSTPTKNKEVSSKNKENTSSKIGAKEESPKLQSKRVRKPSHHITQGAKENQIEPKKIKKAAARTVFRRVRCLKCEGCSQDNCEKCKFCLDSSRNGGPNKLRQSCVLRFCKNPQLPKSIVCKICKEDRDAGPLMECSLCSSTAHPKCLPKLSPCKISTKVNNLWECPDCCISGGDGLTAFSEDKIGGVISENKQKWHNEMVNESSPEKGKDSKRKPQSPKKKEKSTTIVIKKKEIIKSKKSPINIEANRLKKLFDKTKLLNNIVIQKLNKSNGVKRKSSHIDQSANNSESPTKKTKNVSGNKKVTVNLEGTTTTEGEESSEDDEPLVKLKPVVATKTRTESNSGLIQVQPIKTIEPIKVIPPPPFTKYETCLMIDDTDHKLTSNIWFHVFTHLNKNSLLNCMLVCKAWNQWCMNNKLWKHIDVSNSVITQSLLKGIIRRGPLSLNFSTTKLNAKHLEWMLKRLPCLESLDLSLNTATTISALIRVSCLPIKSLNLSWCDAVYDRFLTQVLTIELSPLQPGGTILSTSRLHYLEHLNLTGCDIGDELMYCAFNTIATLKTINISYCSRITKASFDLLIQDKHVCKNLCKITCEECACLSSTDISLLKNMIPNVNFIASS